MRFIKPEKGVELPALSNPGGASDLAQGKELIDGEGNKVTGSVEIARDRTYYSGTPVVDEVTETQGGNYSITRITGIGVEKRFDEPTYISSGCDLVLKADPSAFGDATRADVASGKTFTSCDGVKMTGIATIPDQTVKAGDVYLKSINKTTETGTVIQHSHTLTEDVLLKTGSIVRIGMTNASYGDATAADVAAGKTFTGADGFKKTGTAQNEIKQAQGLIQGTGGSGFTFTHNLGVTPSIIIIICTTPIWMDDGYYISNVVCFDGGFVAASVVEGIDKVTVWGGDLLVNNQNNSSIHFIDAGTLKGGDYEWYVFA